MKNKQTKEQVKEQPEEEKKVRSIDDIIKKAFPSLIDFSLEEEEIKSWIDTGVYALNYIGTKNVFRGYPCGRVVDIYGKSSTGKSMLSCFAAKDPTIDYVLYFETEGSPTKGLLKFLNVDTKKIRGLKCNTFENYCIDKTTGEVKEVSDDKFPKKQEDLETEKYLFRQGATRLMRNFINQIEFNGLSDKKILVILDSLGNIQTTREMNGIKDVGYKSQKIGEFFRSFDLSFERTNILFLYLNKVYTNIMGWGGGDIQNGGVSVEYNPSLSLELSVVSESDEISDSEMKEEKERRNSALGSSMKIIRAVVRKSRFGTELRRISFIIDFSSGPMKFSGLFELCRDFGVIEKAGKMYSCPGIFETNFYKKDFVKRIMENETENMKKIQSKLEEAEQNLKEEKIKLNNSISDMEDVNEIEENGVDNETVKMLDAMA